MAGEYARDMFAADPVLGHASAANSIHNLQRYLATVLSGHLNWAEGLLTAGALAIFTFYCGWYALGRWLFRSPALASLLAAVCGITVWIGWGTFWGVTHSDPVPRVFFAALLPLLLLLALAGIEKIWLRPVAMACCGLCMWVHGVSALNCGAMIFSGYLLMPNSWRHPGNLGLCLIGFFIPVLVFLWPSLMQERTFSADELALFHEVFELRWQEDYSGFGRRLGSFLSLSSAQFPIFAAGIIAWPVCMFRGNEREKAMARFIPGCILGLFCVAAFCWAETHYAPRLGRLPMGHELIRGLRLIVPLAWLAAVGGIAIMAGKWLARLILAIVLALLLVLTSDRQYMAAQYAFADITGLKPPLYAIAQAERERADNMASIMKRVHELVPEGESVYCPVDAMQIRYMARRSLAHSFKDGYVHFYNKDVSGSRQWLRLEKLAASGPDGWLRAWEASGTNWLFCPASQDLKALAGHGRIVMDSNGWILAKKL